MVAKSKGKKKAKTSPEVILEYDFNEEKKGSKDTVKVSQPEVIIEQEEERQEIPKKKKIKVSSKLSDSQKTEEKKGVGKKKEKKKDFKEKKKQEVEESIEEEIEDEGVQDLLNSKKTFVENITRNAKKSPFSAFYPFPKNFNTLSIGKTETVVLIIRHHWSALISKGVLAFLALLFPFLISYSVPTWFEGAVGSTFFLIGLFLFFLMVSITIMVDSFLKWFFQMNIITTKRIIDVDFVSITSHRVSETTLDQVQDVTHSPMGPLASFFDYGDVYVQTAGSRNEFEFNKAPRPRDIQDTILDLRELRKKKFYNVK